MLIEGHFSHYGSARAVLIVTAIRRQFRAVLAEPVAEEFDRRLTAATGMLPLAEAALLRTGVEGWFARARPDRLPWPTADDLQRHAALLGAVRHDNDMPAVIAAVPARPDWVLSTDTAHGNAELAARTGLRIAQPATFLPGLQP